MTDHDMVCEVERDGEYLLACVDCARRVVLRSDELVVIDRGDFAAFHRWSTAGLGFLTVEAR